MNYEYIINPITKHKTSIYSKKGRSIIKYYINQIGGDSSYLLNNLPPTGMWKVLGKKGDLEYQFLEWLNFHKNTDGSISSRKEQVTYGTYKKNGPLIKGYGIITKDNIYKATDYLDGKKFITSTGNVSYKNKQWRIKGTWNQINSNNHGSYTLVKVVDI